MARPKPNDRFASILIILIPTLFIQGCQPASRYTPHAPRAKEEVKIPNTRSETVATALPPIPPEIGWLPDRGSTPSPAIQVVHPETDRNQWEALSNQVWHPSALLQPAGAATLAALEPWTALAVATGLSSQPVLLRIPQGLPDPRPNIPKENPLTFSKWSLGRRLFFDPSWLTAQGKTSCATCHKPDHAFADPIRVHGDFNTPSLLNAVYNTHQFWDGRAVLLEEVVQRTLEDEREKPETDLFRHVWGGVVGRLLENESYRVAFFEAFGSGPTQDNIGRALATYLRTLYSGESLHDLALAAMQKRGGTQLESQDYVKLLTPQRLGELGGAGQDVEVTASELFRGYQLFHDRIPGKSLRCVSCHSGPLLTDQGFHNVGIGYDPGTIPYPGRMAFAPIGQRDRGLNGAFRTPSLRESSRTAPYFHTGQIALLGECLDKHTHPELWNSFLDPAFPILDFRKADVPPLLLFLNSLKGREIDAELRTPPSP